MSFKLGRSGRAGKGIAITESTLPRKMWRFSDPPPPPRQTVSLSDRQFVQICTLDMTMLFSPRPSTTTMLHHDIVLA